MIYREDKKTGNKLSQLGFGCMRFPHSGFGIDMAKSEEIIRYAIDNGVNYFDSAYTYSGSEEALGTIIKKLGVRDKVFITSKLPWMMVKNAPDIDRFFAESFERLKTDYIDYYFMHILTDFGAWEKLVAWGIKERIEQWKKTGKIRAIGFSFHGAYDDFIKILNDFDWDICLIQYNYFDENFQAGVKGLRAAHDKGIPVVIMEPLLGGRLVNNLPEKAVHVFKNANEELGAKRSPAEWGLDWVWNQPEPTVVLSGMSSLPMVEENIRSASRAEVGCLSTQELTVIESVRKIWNANNKINCTGCGYCMPCPKGVNIPGCFSCYNTSYAQGFFTGLRLYMMTTAQMNTPQGASACVHCHRCERTCPQKIAISDRMTDVKKRLEPAPVAFLTRMVRKRKNKPE
jgi:predicted aldo/keto reductase-like oxidoreductase